MRYSVFSKNESCFAPRINSEKFVVDQFEASEFFEEDTIPVSDIRVFANSQSNPELAARIREGLIEREIDTFGDDVSSEDILDNMSSRYLTSDTLLSIVKDKIFKTRLKQKAETSLSN